MLSKIGCSFINNEKYDKSGGSFIIDKSIRRNHNASKSP